MSKKDDIIEYIRCFALNADMKHKVLPGQIKSAILSTKKNIDEKMISTKVWEKITTDSYLDRFIESFDKAFTHEEIKYLLNFYKSDVMKKYAEVGQQLFTKMFEGFYKTIQETVHESNI